MRVQEIHLEGFRNLRKIDLNFPNTSNLFVLLGKNGQGKTNFLEALYIAALSKSFRTQSPEEWVGFDQSFARIKLSTDAPSSEELEVIATREPPKKGLKINGVTKKATEFIGHLPLVFFSPDEMALIHEAPRYRRRYLDILLCQWDRDYLQALMNYQHAMKQRNALLKQCEEKSIQDDPAIEVWDAALLTSGEKIIEKRQDLIDRLKDLLNGYYQIISQDSDLLKIAYLPSAEPGKYAIKLREERRRDIQTNATNYGPHRDDIRFFLNDKDMRLFASRGEWRSLVLALKFAERELLKNHCQTEPLLLLDDVFSELDEERQKYLLSHLGDTQVFLTTTHQEFLKDLPGEKVVYGVGEGSISTE